MMPPPLPPPDSTPAAPAPPPPPPRPPPNSTPAAPVPTRLRCPAPFSPSPSREPPPSRPASLALCGFLIFLNVFAFLLAVGVKRRRITGKVVPDEYDERSYCLYDTDASTVYGVYAFFVLLLAQLLVSGVTRCLCFTVFAVSWCASLKP